MGSELATFEKSLSLSAPSTPKSYIHCLQTLPSTIYLSKQELELKTRSSTWLLFKGYQGGR